MYHSSFVMILELSFTINILYIDRCIICMFTYKHHYLWCWPSHHKVVTTLSQLFTTWSHSCDNVITTLWQPDQYCKWFYKWTWLYHEWASTTLGYHVHGVIILCWNDQVMIPYSIMEISVWLGLDMLWSFIFHYSSVHNYWLLHVCR